MNPELILFGIRSVVRLWSVASDALARQARDANILFPSIETPDVALDTDLTGFFNDAPNRNYVFGENAPYAQYWEGTHVKQDPASVDALLIVATKITAERGGEFSQSENLPAITLVKQWSREQQPASPWSRIILTAADITLQYVSVNPGLLGAKGNGEKLLAAYAANLSDVLPDDGNLGNKEHFGERLLSVFLRAGLSTVNEHPEWVVSKDHISELIKASVSPLLEKWDSDPTKQLKWQDVSDALMGPAASAAMQTLAKHQTTFLGKRLDPDQALGALTQALFLEAAEQRLSEANTKDRLLGLYTAVLNVAAQRPKLFLGDAQNPSDEFNRKLFSDVIKVLEKSPPPFDHEVGTELAAVALDAAAARAARLGQTSEQWRQAGMQMLELLITRLSVTLKTNEKLSKVLTGDQVTELGRLVLTRIADTPAMVLGASNEVWEGVLSAITSAMITDEHLLLSGDDWLQIAGVAAEEAATNPARLFKLDPSDRTKVLAGELMGVLLKAAAKTLKSQALSTAAVLYGKTLREAIIVLLRTSSGNVQAVRTNITKIASLVKQLDEFVARNAERYGSKEWLRLFRILLPAILEGRDLQPLNLDRAEELLKGVL